MTAIDHIGTVANRADQKRRHGCLLLTWADVDMEQKRIFVKDTKNMQNRHTYMTREIEEMFLSRYQNQKADALVLEKPTSTRP